MKKSVHLVYFFSVNINKICRSYKTEKQKCYNIRNG